MNRRRDFLKLPLVASATSSFPVAGSAASGKTIDEYDPANIKLAHRVPARISDEDLLFLKQMG